MYSDTQAVHLLQEIGITNANDKVRFLTSGPIYKESSVSAQFAFAETWSEVWGDEVGALAPKIFFAVPSKM